MRMIRSNFAFLTFLQRRLFYHMSTTTLFSDLSLPSFLLSTLTELGYETPTPVQLQAIPAMLSGRDVLVQAQTGTGKTAAFALPILSKIDVAQKKTQALVIAPTRELAIQVAEAFQSYAKNIKGFHAVSIYGGQDYAVQLRALKRGPQVIVGTPGRLMDHMRRNTLHVDALNTLVLDEADEMLKMGFLEDIEWILEQIKHAHQTGLFSATMPESIQNIAKRYLKEPEKIKIQSKTNTVETIEQCYTVVSKGQKMALLTRFLETEKIEAAIVFARTKNESTEIAEKLQTRGYAAAAINGDMNQASRQKAIERIKEGDLDILVATDVAARGIDVERISHVFNFDIPYDTDTYIHRIGRTGRAGRKGKSWLFVTPRERFLLKDIERAIAKPIQEISPPSLASLREKRREKRVNEIVSVIENQADQLHLQSDLIEEIVNRTGADLSTIANALACFIYQSDTASKDDIKIDKVSLEPERKGGGARNRSGRSRSGSRSDSRSRSGSSDSRSGSGFGAKKRSESGNAKPWERRKRRRDNAEK